MGCRRSGVRLRAVRLRAVRPRDVLPRGASLRGTRLLAFAVGLVLATSACGTSTSGTAGSPGRTTASPAVESTPQTVPDSCGHGIPTTADEALRIIKDGPECPGSTNKFWRSRLGDRWTTPRIISYDDGTLPDSKCAEGGKADDFVDNAFYCPKDDVVAYSNQLMQRVFQQGGPYLPVVILQHELGHRANRIADEVGVVARSEENQADCEAGAETRFAYKAGRLPGTDALKSALLLFQLGDVSNFGDETANDPGAHGTPPQRVEAYGRGYFAGVGTCRSVGENPNGHAL